MAASIATHLVQDETNTEMGIYVFVFFYWISVLHRTQEYLSYTTAASIMVAENRAVPGMGV